MKPKQGLIIWTLRRTGGTNFTFGLSRLLSEYLKTPQHEPFNLDRVYGWITKKYTESNENIEIYLKNILSEPQLIKHCVETVPKDFNFVLAKVAKELDYSNLFLYRKNSLNRILSLYFAQLTGIWGPKQKKVRDEDLIELILQSPIPVENLIGQEKYDRKLLRECYIYLKQTNAKVYKLSYEEIYFEDFESVKDILVEFLKDYELVNKIESFLQEIRAQDAQKTKHLYEKFPNIDEFIEKFNSNFTNFSLDPFDTDFKLLGSNENIPFPESELLRLGERKWILQYANKKGVGAEIGVYRGHFAEVLIRELAPKKIYLIDPWTKIGQSFYSETPYTGYGMLTPQYAREETKRRVLSYIDHCEIILIEDFIENFTFSEKLDWVYLDTSHTYEDTLNQIFHLVKFLKKDGVLMGDDWNPELTHKHHGVYKAVNEFLRNNPLWELVAAGYAGQWCIRRKSNINIIYFLNFIGEHIYSNVIRDFHLDSIPRIIDDDTEFSINGVLVLNEKYQQSDFDIIIHKDHGEFLCKWFIESPWFAKKHSYNPNAKKARFSSDKLRLRNGEIITLMLRDKKTKENFELIKIIRND